MSQLAATIQGGYYKVKQFGGGMSGLNFRPLKAFFARCFFNFSRTVTHLLGQFYEKTTTKISTERIYSFWNFSFFRKIFRFFLT